jgi:DNA helicase-2/ATP-dependent DNA helicase PcrA
VICVLRWIENPRGRDRCIRVLQVLPGVGPASAREALAHLSNSGWDFASLNVFSAPSAAKPHWLELCAMLSTLRDRATWAGQVGVVRRWYLPHAERLYDNFLARSADLDQLEQIAGT